MGDQLVYLGSVGPDGATASLKELLDLIRHKRASGQPTDAEAPSSGNPLLLAEVDYRRTKDNKLRHPSFKGIEKASEESDAYELDEKPCPSSTASSSSESTTMRSGPSIAVASTTSSTSVSQATTAAQADKPSVQPPSWRPRGADTCLSGTPSPPMTSSSPIQVPHLVLCRRQSIRPAVCAAEPVRRLSNLSPGAVGARKEAIFTSFAVLITASFVALALFTSNALLLALYMIQEKANNCRKSVPSPCSFS